MKSVKLLIVMLLVSVGTLAFGQNTISLQSADLRVSGTSTLHDWEMKSSKASGSLKGNVSSTSVSSISDINVKMPIKTLKSGKSGMDSKAYDAMKADKFSNATFELTSAKKSGNGWLLNGYFTLAGKKKSVSLKVSETTSSGVVTLKGSYPFKLSEYGVKPPTAMFGSIKTGNDVKISFTVKFK
ncbi:YceI family protein [Flavobacteriaceae bacterium Ap0902]|nr:YceI family protein [Flavobacteriaceae bacterium Ap0902]